MNNPSYRPTRIIPLTGENHTLGNTLVESQIELPQTVMNLSKSSLDFILSIGDPTVNDRWNNILTLGSTMIDGIQITTRTGTPLVQINNVDVYTRMVLPYVTKFSDYMTYDKSLGNDGLVIAKVTDIGSNFFANNDPVPGSTTVRTDLLSNGARVRGTTANPSVVNVLLHDRGYTEPQYFKQGTQSIATTLGGAECQFSIPLKQLAPHTICSINTDAYFGESLIMRVNFNTVSKLGWESSAQNAETGDVDFTGGASISRLRLTVQVQQNKQIRAALIDRVMTQGVNMVVPYVHSYLYNAPNGTASTHQERWNLSHGSKLLNIYSAVANGQAYRAYNSDISNWGPIANKKVLSFQPSMDSVNLTDYRIDETTMDGYQLLKPLFKDSVIQSGSIYDHNRVFVQSFRHGATSDWLDSDTLEGQGLDLTEEKNYIIDYTTNATASPYRQFMYGVTQRVLRINAGGGISMV